MLRKFSVQKVGIAIALFLFSSESFAQTRDHPIEVGGFITAIDLRDTVGEKPGGFGGRFAYNFTNNFAFDAEAAYFPENSGGNFGQTAALAGLKAGIRSESFGVFAKLRPGVVRFGGDFFRTYNNRSQNYFAVDVGASLEFYPSPRVIVRVDLGDTIVPFGDNTIRRPLPPYTNRPGTTHNFQASFGVGFRF
jgi:Outer membrane protein beta-barrel domain